jgi:hypothetical protein
MSRMRVAGGAGAVATLGLTVAAALRHPQGDIGRLLVYIVLAIFVWTLVAVVVSGRRRGVGVACISGALLSVSVAAYLFFAQPIAFAECGRLAQELTRPECRDHGPAAAVVTSVAVAIVLGAIGIRSLRRV